MEIHWYERGYRLAQGTVNAATAIVAFAAGVSAVGLPIIGGIHLFILDDADVDSNMTITHLSMASGLFFLLVVGHKFGMDLVEYSGNKWAESGHYFEDAFNGTWRPFYSLSERELQATREAKERTEEAKNETKNVQKKLDNVQKKLDSVRSDLTFVNGRLVQARQSAQRTDNQLTVTRRELQQARRATAAVQADLDQARRELLELRPPRPEARRNAVRPRDGAHINEMNR